MHTSSLALVLASVSAVFAHPVHQRSELKIIGRDYSAKVVRETAATGLDILSTGNQAFRDGIGKSDPELLKKLTDDGQAPPFMFLGCSDSRVSEGTVFNAKPGTLFTQRNIANQFQSNDANAQSVLSYAVAELGVNHVIVMGHYGCGGVAAAIASPPTNQVDAANGAVQNWIEPIREIFRTSTRPEIVELRTKNEGVALVEEPDVKEPGFRALVEENVKAGVRRIVADSVISNHFALLPKASATPAVNVTPPVNATITEKRAEGGAPTEVFVHGFVYDIESGVVQDLGISVGPPGVAIPKIPFEAVAKSAEAAAKAHESAPKASETPKKPCEQLCKAKRAFAGVFPTLVDY
ncbi:hypothetical protein GALMADRAFT_61844 [Galerina marginata CBS 339.88]|uniref:Carbonic anhydrase n=1 Tax=Galerina marginata (strain CBS 339.88) TaxID=685588 RepID=A0A067TM15_GALM3|nr:hypothetical protein GALMADRAFT_61844 [Galerina marginata CBS 339.88]